MPVTKGMQALFEEAMAEVETLTPLQAVDLLNDSSVILVDIRDVRELWREGTIAGSVHAPRGMLEAWIDPDSPYYRSVFGEDKKLVFFCAGGVRSALAAKTAQDMGLDNVAHIGGGFAAWRALGAPVEAVPAQEKHNFWKTN